MALLRLRGSASVYPSSMMVTVTVEERIGLSQTRYSSLCAFLLSGFARTLCGQAVRLLMRSRWTAAAGAFRVIGTGQEPPLRFRFVFVEHAATFAVRDRCSHCISTFRPTKEELRTRELVPRAEFCLILLVPTIPSADGSPSQS